MWIVKRIDEADYGCEERMPGEPLLSLVTLECDDGRECSFEMPDDWLRLQDIDEGDEWPDDIDKLSEEEKRAVSQSEWMDNYLEALDEMD